MVLKGAMALSLYKPREAALQQRVKFHQRRAVPSEYLLSPQWIKNPDKNLQSFWIRKLLLKTPSSDPCSSSASPLLPHLFRPREFAAAFETLNPALVREISSLCVLSLWFHLLLHEHHSAWHFCTAALNALPEQCGKWVEWQERHGAVRKKKIGSALISWQKSLDSLARA